MEFEKNFCMQHIVLHFLLDKYKNDGKVSSVVFIRMVCRLVHGKHERFVEQKFIGTGKGGNFYE